MVLYFVLCLALTQYSEEDKDLWLKPDVEATCEFMEFSSKFFNAMNLQESEESSESDSSSIMLRIRFSKDELSSRSWSSPKPKSKTGS